MDCKRIYTVTVILSVLNCPSSLADLCRSTVCNYEFRIRLSRTMTYRTSTGAYDVKLNGTQLQIAPNSYRKSDSLIGTVLRADQVITADGVKRELILINNEFPGPTIEVMEGAEIVVKVINELETRAVTFHWHGMLVPDAPWMDGVPFVSQCPIGPKRTFMYRFRADPSGTHFYHAHIGLQRGDGLWGLLVVHSDPPKLPTFHLTVQDWFHQPGDTIDSMHAYRMVAPGTGDLVAPIEERDFSSDNIELTAMRYQSALLNGRGRFDGALLPLANFTVEPDKRHLFRAVHVGLEFSFKLSIDSHILNIVASDGQAIKPLKVDYLILNPGERFDFEITADQTPAKYLVRAETLKVGTGPNPSGRERPNFVHGVLVYSSAGGSAEPTPKIRQCTKQRNCIYFNCPYQGTKESDYITCVSLSDAESVMPKSAIHKKYGVQHSNYEEYFLNFAFTFGATVNGYRFVSPTSPYFDNYKQSVTECDIEKCKSGCMCTGRLQLPYNKTVQLVLTNLQPPGPYGQIAFAHHAVHLHGHNFAVLKQGFPSFNSSTGFFDKPNLDVSCESWLCRSPKWNHSPKGFNVKNPPIKDTVIIPAGGYVVIRFRTDNPGYWPFHCHQDTHMIEGMQIMIEEAIDKVKQPPPDFPRCPDYLATKNGKAKPEKESSANKTKQLKLDVAEFVGICCALFTLGAIVAILLLKLAGRGIQQKLNFPFSHKRKFLPQEGDYITMEKKS